MLVNLYRENPNLVLEKLKATIRSVNQKVRASKQTSRAADELSKQDQKVIGAVCDKLLKAREIDLQPMLHSYWQDLNRVSDSKQWWLETAVDHPLATGRCGSRKRADVA